MHFSLGYFLILICFLFYPMGCKKIQPKQKNFVPSRCRIVEVRDSTILNSHKVVGFNFICQENDILKEFNFLDENPWKDLGVPILTVSNKYFTDSDIKNSIKRGDISFDVRHSLKNKIVETFHLDFDKINDYFFTYAYAKCRHVNYSPKYAIVSYHLGLHGTTDTVFRKDLRVLFLSGKLILLNSIGEIEYLISKKDHAMTGMMVDTASNILFFNTVRMYKGLGIAGIEIHDIKRDSLLFEIEYDTNWIIITPFQKTDQFTLFDARNDKEHLKEILLFDIPNRKVLKKRLKKDYQYNHPRISGTYIILGKGGGEEETIYDTITVAEFEVVQFLEQDINGLSLQL